MILRKNGNLSMTRNIFKRKMKVKLSHRHMSTFLTSFNNILKIRNSAVMEEVDKISKSLMSSRNIYNLRNLKPKRGKDTLKDCYIHEEETENILIEIVEMFNLRSFIGDTNCQQIVEWVLKVLKSENCQRQPIFVYKEAPFARAFRAKKVMSDEDPYTKRRIQTSIVKNLQSAICWWLLSAFRQVSIPIYNNYKTSLMWRNRYLKVLSREMKDFKARYLPKRINPSICFTSATSHIGPLKLSVIFDKLRPIFVKRKIERYEEAMEWKKVNSALTWCLEKNGIRRSTIRESCQSIYKYLTRNADYPQIFGYTLDISKCFSEIKHRNLICIIERLLDKRCLMYTVCGKGQDDKGYTKLMFITRDSENEAKMELRKRMEHKRVARYTVTYVQPVSSKWLLDKLRTTISSYFYRRGKTTWKITKGVPQGHPLSSLLSTMYLNDFERKHWKHVEYDPRVIYCRYEDDYVVLTTEQSIFRKMAEPLFTGNNGHSLKANKEKSKDTSKTQKLFWCGVNMDLKNATFTKKKRGSDRRIPMKF